MTLKESIYVKKYFIGQDSWLQVTERLYLEIY